MSDRGHFRGLARRPVSLAGTLTAEDGGWQRAAHLTDLGLGGARVSVDRDVPVGARVRLSVAAPNRWDPLEIEAKVAWAHGRGEQTEAGLRFDHTSRHVLRGVLELLGEESYD